MTDHTERLAIDDYDALILEQVHGRRGRGNHKVAQQSTSDDAAVAPLDVIAHRDVRPSFLASSAAGTFSKQIDIIVPVTSSTATLPKAAEKGSAVLQEFKREEERARQSRDNMDVKKSDLFRLLGDEPTTSTALLVDGEDDARELASLQNKIRVIEGKDGAPHAVGANKEGTNTSSNAIRHEKRAALTAAEDARRIAAGAAADSGAIDAHRERILQTRRSLPVYQCRSELLRYIGENTVSIVMGETGSGKTTQLVQYLYEAGYAQNGKRIGCTQPRRLAAIGVATRVADEVGCVLGTTVGYSIHLDDMTTEATKIRFMTDGVLLREIVQDPDVEQYSVIVMDEAHERSIDTDVLLGVLKDVCRRRTDIKIVVTSATMNIMKFSSFFGNAPYYEIPGKTFDVDVRYASAPVEDYVHEAVLRAIELHIKETLDAEARQQKRRDAVAIGATAGDDGHQPQQVTEDDNDNGGDILIFMTGRDDVFGTCEMIHKKLVNMAKRRDGASWDDSLLIIPCLSEAVSTSQTLLFDPAPPGKRKCIVSTNVAETSLTIDGVRFVIDCGMMKTNVYHPTFGMNTLKRYPTSQAQANQRKGRAGRTAEGTCFRLYTKEQFATEMLPSTVPEIQRSSVDTVVLLLKSIGVKDLSAFDFIDAPPEANLRNSLWQLWLLGAVDGVGDITESGRCMLAFPVNPTLANILIHSARLGCSSEVLSIVSMLSADVKGLFECPPSKEEEARQSHGRFYNGESDHLTYFNVYHQYTHTNARNRHWCRENFLNAAVLDRAFHVREQLHDKMQRLKLPIVSAGDGNTDVVRECLVYGYCLQAARRAPGKWSEYTSLLNAGVTCHVLPTSSILSGGNVPEYIVYDDLMFTTKEYLMTVTAVDPRWLVAVGRGLYTIKGEAYDPSSASAQDACLVLSKPQHRVGGATTGATTLAERQQVGSSLFDDLLQQSPPPPVTNSQQRDVSGGGAAVASNARGATNQALVSKQQQQQRSVNNRRRPNL